MEKIIYSGRIIDKDGRRPDLEPVTTIKDMPAPENVSSLQSFFGLANYYHVFTPNMHNLRDLLNELLKDKDWEWMPECKEAFVKNKRSLDVGLVSHH